MDQNNKIKHKTSVTVEAGYMCNACNWETVTYEATVPPVCLNCQTPDPQKKWSDKITHVITVESLGV